jgi:hypothetical protein
LLNGRPALPSEHDPAQGVGGGIVKRILALGLLLLVAGCGGSIAPGGEADAPEEAAESPPDDVAPDAVEADCADQLGDLVAALEELDGRLDVGLNFQAYSERAGDASVAYQRIDIEDLGPNCLERVGAPAEDALNSYISANNTWNDCIQDVDCDNDSITPDLQAEWANASESIEEAREALDE